jgi:Asp-tRNA(Asn)/Glu-tRNA(Gln) amidotransferase A subunit family amidase
VRTDEGTTDERTTDEVTAAVEAACDRIDELDGLIAAFLPEPGRRERLRGEARDLLARVPPRSADRPPLYGMPVAVKDIIHVDGLPTRAGSEVPAEVLAGRQAVVVDRLRAAGALVAGKTVTAEFAVSAPGPTRNPRDPAHTPGGSSSGSAAAVAAGMVPLALGTQTVGSVVRPAAYCGVVGFRPTHGRVPMAGVIPNVPSYDVVGTFARDVAGAALGAGVLCDDWRWPEVTRDDARPLVLGVPLGPYPGRADAEAVAAFEAGVRALRAAGHTVRETAFLPDFAEVVSALRVINRYELARTHAEWFPAFGPLYRTATAASIREGLAVTPQEYAAADRVRQAYLVRLDALMGDAGLDGWLTPAATGPAPRGLESTGDPVMCLPWSGAGLPAVTVPCGTASGGLPLGLQCVGLRGGDERLLGWAATVEATVAPS